VNLPSTLASFSNFLLGEIFSQVSRNPFQLNFNPITVLVLRPDVTPSLEFFQDPLRASDKVLTSCGPYLMKEEDAMVYRRPYLVSGSSGFALNAISKAMKKDLKVFSLIYLFVFALFNSYVLNWMFLRLTLNP
jgi:hypothetical protein